MKLFELSNTVKGISSSTNEKDILNLLRNKCKNSYDASKKQPIFTKIISKEKFLILDPEKTERKSKFIIDGLTSLLSSWKNYANRQHCVRGWTDQEIAENRGEGSVYLLIPYDGATIYVSKTDNFYRSFSKANQKLEIERLDNGSFENWYHSLFKVAKSLKLISGEPYQFNSAKQFIKSINSLNDLKKQDLSKILEEIDLRRVESFQKSNKLTLEEYLSGLLDPDDNSITSFITLYNLTSNREIWTKSKCIAILLDEYKEMYKRGSVK